MELSCLASRQHIVIQRVPHRAPLQWLKLGWRDLQRTANDALLYGAGFVLLALQLISEIIKALCVLTDQRPSLEEID